MANKIPYSGEGKYKDKALGIDKVQLRRTWAMPIWWQELGQSFLWRLDKHRQAPLGKTGSRSKPHSGLEEAGSVHRQTSQILLQWPKENTRSEKTVARVIGNEISENWTVSVNAPHWPSSGRAKERALTKPWEREGYRGHELFCLPESYHRCG